MLTKKRFLDLISSSFVLLCIFPLGILAYPLLMFLVGHPILLQQKRIGKNGKEFTMYKLRSMKKNALATKIKYLSKNEAPLPMFKIAADPRFIKKEITFFGWRKKPIIIKVGEFLSSSGLDELPQFLNIFKGEMSLIGPRPLPVKEAKSLKKIDQDWYKWRHDVQPGIFSVWAADPKHNQSLTYWKKLEAETLQMNDWQRLKIIWQIIIKQIKNLLKFIYRQLA